MNPIGKSERETQNRVTALFRDELKYRYLGDHSDCPNNSNIDGKLLTAYLAGAGYSTDQISRAGARADHGPPWFHLMAGRPAAECRPVNRAAGGWAVLMARRIGPQCGQRLLCA